MNYDVLFKHSAAGQYYVYVYLDPRYCGRFNCITSSMLSQPFYVGKGVKNRYRIHLSLPTKRHPLNNKIQKIRNVYGSDPYTVIIQTFSTEADAYNFEQLLISHLTIQSIPLTNLTDGGINCHLTSTNSLLPTRLPSPALGKPRTSDVKQKISESKKIHHPTAKRWMVIDPDGCKHTPKSMRQFIKDILGLPDNAYKTLINVHLGGNTTVKQGIMKGWQIFLIS